MVPPLEEKLVEAEKKYADQKFLYPSEGESIKTSLKEFTIKSTWQNINP